MEVALFFVLFLAVAAGFVLGKGQGVLKRKHPRSSASFQHNYFLGLNQLLRNEPDTAIETFVSSLEVTSLTLDTHLAMGALLRRRGEVDKAIRIHQNLLSRPGLTPHQNEQVQLELALDYKKSGLLDRQEILLRELSNSGDADVRTSALSNLVAVYQEWQEWQKAIETAEQLCHKRSKADQSHWRHLQAHFCSELADQARQSDSLQSYLRWTHQALSFERENPRAALNMALWELEQGKPKVALKWLNVAATEPALVSEAARVAERCFENMGKRARYLDFLRSLFDRRAEPALILLIVDQLAAQQSELAALEFLQRETSLVPSLKSVGGLLAAVDLRCVRLDAVKNTIHDLLPPSFQCRQCGFQSGRVFWCCPTCRRWL